MAVLCPKHDLLYIRVPSTGSSVVANVLVEELEGEKLLKQDIQRDGQTVVPRTHCTVSELVEHGVLSPDLIDSSFVVANVRNPFDRWTTYYQRRVGEEWLESSSEVKRNKLERNRDAGELSDEEYEQRKKDIEQREQQQKRKGRLMRWAGFNNWVKYTLLRWKMGTNSRGLGEYAFPMLSGVDVAIRQERLNEGLNQLLDAADAGIHLELPESNTTSGKKPYTDYYSWTTRALVERMIGPQMEKFGYDFEGPTDDRSVIFL